MTMSAMDFLQTTDFNPTLLNFFLGAIFGNLERQVEPDAWAYFVGDEVVLRINTKDNAPHGECVMFYPDRKPAIVGEFVHGTPSGQWKYFRPNGEPWES
jgi:hypothetical protein